MSVETIKTIISRAMTEPEFKEKLFSDPPKTLEGYELTDQEIATLKAISREEFDALGGNLEERVSRVAGRLNFTGWCQ